MVYIFAGHSRRSDIKFHLGVKAQSFGFQLHMLEFDTLRNPLHDVLDPSCWSKIKLEIQAFHPQVIICTLAQPSAEQGTVAGQDLSPFGASNSPRDFLGYPISTANKLRQGIVLWMLCGNWQYLRSRQRHTFWASTQKTWAWLKKGVPPAFVFRTCCSSQALAHSLCSSACLVQLQANLHALSLTCSTGLRGTSTVSERCVHRSPAHFVSTWQA